jgi:hypothetical protein
MKLFIKISSYFLKLRNVITASVEGLKDYFDVVLSTKLLYKSEKLQYAEVIEIK